MSAFNSALIGATLLPFAISVTNLFLMRKLSPSLLKKDSRASILVPMRNEERNAKACVESILSSRGFKNYELIVLNDNSRDRTLIELEDFSPQIQIIQGKELAEGWLGKPFACQQLAENSAYEFLVFMDADVRVAPEAIARAIETMQRLEWDFISPYPAQNAPTFLMKLIQPLLQWSWLTSVPLRIAESGRFPSMIVANGQLLIVKREAYYSIAGHAAVSHEVLEDLMIARALTKAGFKGGVVDASALVHCTMYQENSELVAGYTKSLWRAFGGVAGSIVTIALLLITQLLPVLMLAQGAMAGAIAFLLISSTHLFAGIKTRSSLINTFLHPLAALVLIYLIVESHRRKIAGRLEWRGRKVL